MDKQFGPSDREKATLKTLSVEEDEVELWWDNRELEEHFQFGADFFGLEMPFEIHVAEVNASVLTSLLLIRIGIEHGRELAQDKDIWNRVFAMLFNFYMSKGLH